MKHLKKFNEGFDTTVTFMSMAYRIISPFMYFISSWIISSMIISKIRKIKWTKYLKNLNDIKWNILDDKNKTITISSDGQYQGRNISMSLDLENRKIDILYSCSPIDGVSTSTINDSIEGIDIGGRKFNQLVSNIRKFKEISDEVMDFSLDIKDLGFSCSSETGVFHKNISISIRKEGTTYFDYSEISDEVDGLIKRCSNIGLFFIGLTKKTMLDYIDGLIGVDKEILEKTVNVQISFEIV